MNTNQINEAQPLPQTRKVHLQTTFHRIPRHMNNLRRSTNGQHKGRKGVQLKSPDKHHRSPQIPGIYRLLLLLHQGLLKDHLPIITIKTLDDPLDMDQNGTNGI
jgi:hypothetical protein